MLRLSRRHIVLLEQLRQFPMGKHDDGPHALQMAVSVTSAHPPTLSGVSSRDDERNDPHNQLFGDEGWDEYG